MQFPSKLFLDGGDPEETRQADKLLKKAGYHGLDGQTTNPSLIAERSVAVHHGEGAGGKVTTAHAVSFYRETVREMARVTTGPISIQVTGGPDMTAKEMLSEARERISWIPNGVIKFPCTAAGLTAASEFCEEGPVNMTLAFSQAQAAAVYSATAGHGRSPDGKPYDVFVSPFVGRLDDRGENGMDVVANILAMYRKLGDGHVRVLTASVRTVRHILYALFLKSDVITIPFTVFKEWAVPPKDSGREPFILPAADFIYDVPGLTDIAYEEMTLDLDWHEYDTSHDLTTAGVAKFWADWQTVVG
ncbi:transaldolase [Patescibacteria group bacterium]|nr:transaldolase [Patescibacteria group bacterium]